MPRVRVDLRDAIAKRSSTAEAEISLRAFYATNPPVADDDLHNVSDILGVQLTDLGDDDATVETAEPAQPAPAQLSVIDLWVGGERLPNPDAPRIRKWILDALAARLQNGLHGFSVTR